MKPGDSVLIYEDPITQQKEEGFATVKQITAEDDEFISLVVQFLDDDFGSECHRTVYKKRPPSKTDLRARILAMRCSCVIRTGCCSNLAELQFDLRQGQTETSSEKGG